MHDIELLYIEDILAIHEEAIKSFGGIFELYKDSKINGHSDNVDDDEAYAKAIQISCSQLTGKALDTYILELSHWLKERFPK